MFSLADPLVLLFVSAFIFIAPFTKVEESFNTQAVHDLIHYGLDVSKFDHVLFPGPVPRTFIGSLLLTAITKPVLRFIPKTFTKLDGQLISRGMLGTVNALFIVYLKDCAFKALKRTFAEPVKVKKSKKSSSSTVAVTTYNPWSFGLWFILFQIAQFHVPFYASRCLPNTMVLPLTNYAFGQLFLQNYSTAITVLSFAAVVFRIELIALVFAVAVALSMYSRITSPQLIKAGMKGAIFGAILSGVIDSYFWGRFTIPELESFLFNVVHGKSAEWGVEPYHAYFSKYLLAIFMPPHVLLLAILGYFQDPTKSLFKIAGVASLLYVMILSLQPHKELRFIIYTAPVFTVLGAGGASILTSNFSKSFLCKLLVLCTLFLTLVSMSVSVVWGEVSSFNYPGGFAFNTLHELLLTKKIKNEIADEDEIVVHIDTAACMTGVTHFGEFTDLLLIKTIYDKTESPSMEQWHQFDYLISDVSPKDNTGSKIPYIEGSEWIARAGAKGYAGLDLRAFRNLDLMNLIFRTWRTKSPMPVIDAIKMFIHQKDVFWIYEKVASTVEAAPQEPIKHAEPVKPKRTRKKLTTTASVEKL